MFFIGIKKILKKDESSVSNFTEISYFAMYADGKWGVINSNGDNVIDPFVGIGSTLVACKRTGRNGFGIELNPKYYETVCKRLDIHQDKKSGQ